MINQQIYLDGDLLDLYQKGAKSIIATTIPGFNIGNLIVRQSVSTNRVTVPPTQNNRKILGLNDEHSTEVKPYRKKTATLIQNGIEIISNGVAIIEGFNGSDYAFTILSGVYTLFQQIAGVDVDEIDFGEYAIIDDSYISSTRESLDLISSPVFDYGTLFPSPQKIVNDTFIGDLAPTWKNVNTGDADTDKYNKWLAGNDPLAPLLPYSDGTIFNSQRFVIPVPPQKTTYLSTDYFFFKGFTYKIKFIFRVKGKGDAGVPTNHPNYGLEIFTTRNETRTSIHNTGLITPGTETIDVTQTVEFTFISDDDYLQLEFQANLPSHTNFDVDTYQTGIAAKLIKITDEKGLIDIKSPYYIPMISYSKIIDRIVTNAGFTLSLDMQNQAYYERLYLVYSKDKYAYPDKLIDKIGFNYSAPGTQTLSLSSGGKQPITFNVQNKQGVFAWYNGLTTYDVPAFGYTINMVVKALIIVDVAIAGTDAIGLHFQLDGVTQTQTETITTSGRQVFTFESDSLDSGLSPLTFSIAANRASGSGTNTLKIVGGNFYVDVSNEVLGTVNISALVLPTVSQKDFVADFFYRFGIIAEEKDKVITGTEVNKIIKRRLTKDWTQKRDHGINLALSYVFSGYAQQNIFSDVINSDLIVRDGNASIDIDNDTLELTKDYYTSIMSTVEQNINNGIQLCRLNVFDRIQDDGHGSFDSNPRLVYLRDKMDSDAPVKYNGVIKSTYLVAVYNDPLVSYNTTWRYFLNNYYPLLKSALQKAKTTTAYYLLDDVDIYSTSVAQLIFDDGADYLIVSVTNYVPGQKTKVVLFKVS